MKLNNIKYLALMVAISAAVGCSEDLSQAPAGDVATSPVLNVTRAEGTAVTYIPDNDTKIEVKNFLSSDFTDDAGSTVATYTYNDGSWATNDKLQFTKTASELYLTAFVKSGNDTAINRFTMPLNGDVVDQSGGVDAFDYLYYQGTVPYSDFAVSLSLAHVMAKVNVEVVLTSNYNSDLITASVDNVADGATRESEGADWIVNDTTVSVKPQSTAVNEVVTLSLLMPAQMWSQEISFKVGDVKFSTTGDGYNVESGKEYTFRIYTEYSDNVTVGVPISVNTFGSAIVATAPEAIDTRDWDGETATAFAGSGTESDPYIINTAANLAYLAQSVNDGTAKNGYRGTYFVLAGDMSLKGYEWTPIGSLGDGFQGNFDGAGYTISDMKITQMEGTTYAGLFGMTNNAKNYPCYIKNLTIDSATIDIATSAVIPKVGFLVGYVGRATDVTALWTIENCVISNSTLTFSTTDSTTHYIGGISGDAGESAPVHFAGCKVVNCSLTSGALMGGIVGRMQYGLMQGCENDNTTIYTSVKSAGGLCAFLSLAGRTAAKGDATIVGCKSSGTISRESAGSNYITGGIVSNCYGRVVACFSDTNIVNPKDSGYTGAIIGQTLANTKLNNATTPNAVAMMFNCYTTNSSLDAIGKELVSEAGCNTDVNGINAQISSFSEAYADLNSTLRAVVDKPEVYFYANEAGLDVDNVTYTASYLFDESGNIVKVE
ncbi:MAG: fimbrillin family protein [Rikenellaceae bacterium]